MDIDFRLDISRDEAFAATIFPFDPQRVVEDYRKTGLTPVRGVWLDRRRGCACPVGVYVADDPRLGSIDNLCLEDFFGITPEEGEWLDEFAIAFDKGDAINILEKLAGDASNKDIPGWEILAWRNALAVMDAMNSAGLEVTSETLIESASDE